MKVSDLIVHLQALPQDAIVVVTDSSCCGCRQAAVGSVEHREGKEVFLDAVTRYQEAHSTDAHISVLIPKRS